MEGPRGHICYFKPRISATPRVGGFWRVFATTQTPVPTLPSRAHPQDDGSKTTPSNYNMNYSTKFSKGSKGSRFGRVAGIINFMRFEGRTARRDNNFLVRRSNVFYALELIILGFEGRMLYLVLND